MAESDPGDPAPPYYFDLVWSQEAEFFMVRCIHFEISVGEVGRHGIQFPIFRKYFQNHGRSATGSTRPQSTKGLLK
jgi:hypothetical protein